MSKINILYVITKLELGGAQKQLFHLIYNLDKDRFNVFLFTARDGLLLDDFLSIKGLTLKRSVHLERSIHPFKDLLAYLEIRHFIKENHIEIVHTHSSKAGLLGRLAAKASGVKWIIHTVHGWSFNDLQPRWRRDLVAWLERRMAAFTTQFIVVSHHDRKKGISQGIGGEAQYRLIRYGINSQPYPQKDCSLRKELGIYNGDLVVGMVSCLKPQKSPLDFIRMAHQVHQELPSVKFILAGDGILRKRVLKLIKHLHLEGTVILAGWRGDIPRVLSCLDVFVLTSLWEGLPIAALEAMSVSLPVVATDTGGISEVVSDGETGFLAKPGDIRGLSHKLSVLLRNESLRRQMGAAARNKLGSDFTHLRAAKETQDMYLGLS